VKVCPSALTTTDIYTAARVLLAARLRPTPSTDSSNYSISDSWDRAIQVLKSFERLGHSAQKCVAALESLSAKVPKVDPAGSNTVAAPRYQDRLESVTSPKFADLGEHMGDFDFRGIEVDLSDMSWLNILPGDLN
jgi:hypothetical protein